MMMTRMAKKLDIGGYECIRPDGFESRGGGRRRGKPLLQIWLVCVGRKVGRKMEEYRTVSYTHLTLPTTGSV